MSSDKPRIATYTDKITVNKFKIIAAYNNLSMSEYLDSIVKQAINKHEKEHGPIILDSFNKNTTNNVTINDNNGVIIGNNKGTVNM